jgi:peptide/nickel transport system substrate-binding protein
LGKICPVALVLVLLLASILVIPNSSGDSSGETFVRATIGGPSNLDPAVNYDSSGGEVIQNVYESLLWYDGSSTSLIPKLATEVPTLDNGGMSSDGLTYTFYLRDGVKFHNGDVLTADDVTYSIKRALMINIKGGPAWMLGQVLIPDYYLYDGSNYTGLPAFIPESECAKAIWAKGPLEVQFNLTRPYPAFNSVMAYTVSSVISKRFVEECGGIVPGEQNWNVSQSTCGTGPYYLGSFTPGVSVNLERFDDYWGGPASIPHVIIQTIDDYGTMLMMLQNGDADSAAISRAAEADVSFDPNLRAVKDYPTFSMEFLGFNQQIDMNYNPAAGTDTVPSDFFADSSVRKAFAYAFDYDSYIANCYLGGAIKPNGVIPQGMFGYDSSIPYYDYDLTMAALYLNSAVADPDSGETWGERGFTITVMYNSGNYMREMECQLLKAGMENLTSLGLVTGTVQVNIMALDWSIYMDAQSNKGLPIFFLGWMPDYADPDDYVVPFLQSAGVYARWCSISDGYLDSRITAASSELDPGNRAVFYTNISSYVYDQCFYLWTAQPLSFHVERTWVQGYYYNPMYCGLYYYTLSFQAQTPETVSGLEAFVADGKALIVWNALDITPQYYNVYRSDTPGGDRALVTSTSSIQYLDESVLNGQTYYYTVTAVNSVGESPPGPEVSATPDTSYEIEWLWIDGDDQLMMFQYLYGWSGSGTPYDPIVISGLDIDASGREAGIYLGHLMLSVAVSGCVMRNATYTHEESYGAGLVLDGVVGTTVQGCSFLDNVFEGVVVFDSTDCIIRESLFDGGLRGLYEYMGHSCHFIDNTVTNTTGPGVYVSVAEQCSWTGNVFINTNRSMEIWDSSSSTIDENVMGQDGEILSDVLLQMLYSHDMLVQGNTFRGSQISMFENNSFYGIGALIGGYSNNFSDNNFLNCSIVWAEGYEMDRSSILIDETNTVNGRPTYFMHDIDLGGGSIPSDGGAVILYNVQNARLSGANLSNSTIGLQVMGCIGLVIEDCNMDDCYIGAQVLGTSLCSITGSSFSRNMYAVQLSGGSFQCTGNEFHGDLVGIYLNYADSSHIDDNLFEMCLNGMGVWGMYNSVVQNRFVNCSSYGIMVGDGYNQIYLNQFIRCNGATDVYDPAHPQVVESSYNYANQWYLSDGTNSIGNYWSDLTVPDDDLDGIVDVPYPVSGSIYDMRPIARLTGPPGNITQFYAIGQDAAILLQWNPPGNAMVVGVTSYDIYRWEGTDRVLLANVPYPTNEYLDEGLELGREYTYQISAINIDGEGPLSINVTGVPVSKPGAPRQLMGSISNGTVALSWNAPTDSDMANIDFYVVYMNGKDIKHVEGNSTDITGLSFGKYYSFSVAAHNALGEGPLGGSILVMQSGAPEAPMLLANFLDVSCELTWTRPSDGGPEIVHYQLYRSNASGFWTLIATTEWRNYTDMGLVNGEPYRYKVCAVNELGMGPSSNVVNGTPLPWPGEMGPSSVGPVSPDNVSGGSTLDTGNAGLGDGAGPVGHASVWGWLVGMVVLVALVGTALWRGRKGS